MADMEGKRETKTPLTKRSYSGDMDSILSSDDEKCSLAGMCL